MTPLDAARAWIDEDSDPVTVEELKALVAKCDAGDEAARRTWRGARGEHRPLATRTPPAHADRGRCPTRPRPPPPRHPRTAPPRQCSGPSTRSRARAVVSVREALSSKTPLTIPTPIG